MEIVRYSPNDILQRVVDPEDPVSKMLLAGYDFEEEALTEENIRGTLEGEYNYLRSEEKPGLEGTIYIAEEERTPVGSLTVVHWTPENDLGQRFQNHLNTYPGHPDIQNPKLMEIGGIVVAPNVQKNGIAGKMLRRATEDFNPDITVGQTKTPAAVAALRRSLPDSQTSYGRFNVTKNLPPIITSERESVAKAFMDTRGYRYDIDLTFFYNTTLSSAIPDTSNFPQNIIAAFDPVITRQLLVPDKTIEAPVIAIRRRLLQPAAY